ncbi:GCN5-related N-acetyltransferase [Kribbella flavida DSM 17836]|uniref:GCN5-related N-acetyltransferase n=1 Tax=Kribbella flavida (strain DSM 17836 / JCM 10339 / NBRC 14399) TaxID=479435 RepID=D2Q0T0_KRIFD|nr:GNAT family N-acetyltransferase [Kribbella flavida]ADB33880.1 GCN5-related N-acetyltransferase [Kribbella flavida DSM 17836]
MTTDIRPARPDEYAAVGELTVEAYASDGFIPAGSGLGDTLRAAADRAERAELWVATDGTDLLGTVTYCRPGSFYREIARDDEGEFRMLAVSGKARGQGLGTALTVHCINRSRELGYRRLVMSSADYMLPAHRMYQRLGFTRIPDRDWSPRPGVALIAFALDL